MYSFIFTIASVAQETATSEEGASLAFNPWTFLFSIILISTLFFLLKIILFKPVTKIINNRTERIRKSIFESEKKKNEAEQLKSDYQNQLEQLKSDITNIMDSSEQKAKSEAEEILNNAKREAQLILEKARELGQKEVEQALENAKNQISALAIQAASKVIERNMDDEANRKLVEQFLNEVGAA